MGPTVGAVAPKEGKKNDRWDSLFVKTNFVCLFVFGAAAVSLSMCV